jgi:hypothetical protein
MADFPSLQGISIEVQRIPVYSTTVLIGDSGIERRYSWGTPPRYKYILKVEVMLMTELTAFNTFISTHIGPLYNFTFVDPYDSLVRTVRFDMEEFELEQLVVGLWTTATIKMITVD